MDDAPDRRADERDGKGMKTMNRNRNLIRMRQRRILRELNRESRIQEVRGSFEWQLAARILMTIVAFLIVVAVIVLMEIKAENDAWARVLRRTSIAERYMETQAPEAPEAIMVEALQETAQAEEAPPEAIEVKDAAPAAAVPAAERWESLGTWKLTAYCPQECCNGKGRAWKTASGAPMKTGRTVAAAGLPFGTELMINGQIYVVEDRGVSGKHVDILFQDHKSARNFGVQKAEVFIKR